MWHHKGKLGRGLFVLVCVVTLLSLTAGQSGVEAAGVGIYAGGHETVGGMGKVAYNYSLELKEDQSYEIKSYFIMGDELYDFTETGTYVLDAANGKITITPQGQEAIDGSLNKDGSITIGIKPSQMAPRRTESTLTLSTNKVAGVYGATLQGPTVVEATLYLTHAGEYFYMAVPSNDTAAVHESGTYSVSGTEISFKIADSADTFKGTVDGDEIAAPFIVSAVMGMRMEIKLGLK